MSARSNNVLRSLQFNGDPLPLLDSRPSIRGIISTTLVASLILAAIGVRIGPELRMRPSLANAGAVVDSGRTGAVDRQGMTVIVKPRSNGRWNEPLVEAAK